MSSNPKIKISKEEAVIMQWKMILNWKPRSDVWPFTYGVGFISGLGALNGAILNQSFRTALKLSTEFRLTCFLPNVIMPSFAAGAFHAMFISSEILISNIKCLPCTQTKAAGYQLGFGLAYPLVMAPLVSMIAARHFYTYDIPSPLEITKVCKLWWNLTKTFQGRLNILTIVNIAAAAFVTAQEANAISVVESKLDKMIEDKQNTSIAQ